MKTQHILTSSLALIALLASCANSQYATAYDDIYYSPSDEVYAQQEEPAPYVDIDDRDYEPEGTAQDYPRGREVDEYFDPEYKSNTESEYIEGYKDGYNDRYQDDAYYYSSRMRRFNPRPYGFGYMDPFYSNSYWMSYDPFFWSPRMVRPSYYSPGWGFGWNNSFGWTANYNNGWYNGNGWNGGWSNGVYGYNYNPYGYYGNVYCPPYGAGGYAYNDFYNGASANVYTGQYNAMGAQSASSRTALGKLSQQSNFSSGSAAMERPEVARVVPGSKPTYTYDNQGNRVAPTRVNDQTSKPNQTRETNARPTGETRPQEREVHRPSSGTAPEREQQTRERSETPKPAAREQRETTRPPARNNRRQTTQPNRSSRNNNSGVRSSSSSGRSGSSTSGSRSSSRSSGSKSGSNSRRD